MAELEPEEHTERVRAHYIPLLEEFGGSSRAVDYHHSGNHLARFLILAGIDDINDASILDVGCGVGHFAKWLMENGFEGEYTGVDLLPEMVERARELNPGMRFETCDILAEPNRFRADYVMSSGIFHLGDAPFMQRVIAALYEACGKGVAFNSLSAWDAVNTKLGYFSADPAETLNFCRTLTPFVMLRHDYLPHDFTMFLYRE
jgi:SAM-dependent methyltransferase